MREREKKRERDRAINQCKHFHFITLKTYCKSGIVLSCYIHEWITYTDALLLHDLCMSFEISLLVEITMRVCVLNPVLIAL